MKKVNISILHVFVAFLFCSGAYSDTTKISDYMGQQAVVAKKNYCRNHLCIKFLYGDSGTIGGIENPVATSNGYNLSAVTVSDFPTEVQVDTLYIPNCTNQQIAFNKKLETQIVDSLQITQSKTIQNEASVTLNLPELNLGVVKFGGGNISGKEVVTDVNGTTSTKTVTKTDINELNTVIPPFTATKVLVTASKQIATTTYSGIVNLDGTIRMKSGGSLTRAYASFVSANGASNVLNVQGAISNTYANRLNVAYSQSSLNPSTCQPISNLKSSISIQAKPNSNSPAVTSLNDSYAPYGFNGHTPVQTIEKIHSGDQIMTANVVGSIQVRATSKNSAICNISFQYNDANTSLSIAPQSNSDWITLKVHEGVSIGAVNFQDTCNGLVDTEVKYFK